MNRITVNSAKKIEGVISVPGDKSISHRAVMFGSLAVGITEVSNFLMAGDCVCTIKAFREMGIKISAGTDKRVVVDGKGLRGLQKPKGELYLGNSGTTMRLLLGILSGQDFECVLTGDESLSRRPMKRVSSPLSMMGADIKPKIEMPRSDDLYPPLKIKGKYPLKAIQYKLPIASAQVKSAVLLAGLYCEGVTEIEEPLKSRDHTERMLKRYGAGVSVDGLKVSVRRSVLRPAGEIFVPGDISSAAFFMVAPLILRSSSVRLENVGINPTRTGIIDILKAMGADIVISNVRDENFEPIADITVKSSGLKGVNIEGEIMPRAIDEIPIVMVAAAFAKGQTVIRGAGELRVKETDRIESMAGNLKRMGADIRTDGDDIVINGLEVLRGIEAQSYGDHRTAMSIAIAGLRAEGRTTVLDTDCVNTSFPEFESLLRKLIV